MEENGGLRDFSLVPLIAIFKVFPKFVQLDHFIQKIIRFFQLIFLSTTHCWRVNSQTFEWNWDNFFPYYLFWNNFQIFV